MRCWVGKRRLDIAIDRVKKDYKINIKWLPFILNPWLPEEGMNFKEFAMAKFGEGGLKKFLSGQVPFYEQGKELVSVKTAAVMLTNQNNRD